MASGVLDCIKFAMYKLHIVSTTSIHTLQLQQRLKVIKEMKDDLGECVHECVFIWA